MTSGILQALGAAVVLAAQGAGPGHDHEFDSHAAHEHGKLTLNLALEGTALHIELQAPAHNVTGFEHAPRSDAERARLHERTTWLKAGSGLFAFPADARCVLESTEVQVPAWQQKGDHPDFTARFTFRCAAAARPALQTSQSVQSGAIRVRLR